ncbi:MAG: beta-ketoacyl-ACP synthase II [Microscillaceae bacterium]|jgi:3-oxoacyl-[acyl-carrier-protein] synthase II|nr:beta-ketoacyl-ACP synthase II [Microscillaceae bacterium]
MQLKRVVVTGLGALTPIGNTVQEYWHGLSNGVSGAALVTKFDPEKFRTKFACEVKNFNIEDFVEKKEAKRMDWFTQYALVVAGEAIRDAGMDLEQLNRDRIGVIWASGIGGLRTFEDEVTYYAQKDGTPRFNPFFIPKMIANMASGYISIKYGLRGINFTTVSACASSNHAFIDAFNYIRLGKADIFVSGGAEAAVTQAGMGGFSVMKAMSERNDDPATASRPFDKDRDGFVLGEGAACLILEELEHAKARGAKIYAELIGGGMTADAYHISAPHPEGIGVKMVMEHALQDAGITADKIDYINVHGTSTPIGDPQEVKAIQAVFGEHAYKLNISSTKSMTGHLLGAAGAIEAVASLLAMQNQIVPPTINHFTDDEAFDPNLNFTFNKAQARKIDYVMSNGFGFGGHNSSVIFKKFEA